MPEVRSTHSPAARDKVATINAFFGWEHLLLLATPFPVLLVAQAAYILGLDNDARDSIFGIYMWPAVLISFGTFFILPTILALTLLFFLGRNIFIARPKRLILYGVVLVIFPIATHWVDADYLRFVLQEERLKTLLADKSSSMPERSAYCFVFDKIVDNFYVGGANFASYDKFLLYVSEDVVTQPNPRINTFLSDTCPTEPVSRIRRLTGRFYLADASHDQSGDFPSGMSLSSSTERKVPRQPSAAHWASADLLAEQDTGAAIRSAPKPLSTTAAYRIKYDACGCFGCLGM
jgi:hypothetical protein